jgi:hypothetical protein
MIKQLIYIIISLFIGVNSFAACIPEGFSPDSVNDGPYIFRMKNNLNVRWFENGKSKRDRISQENYPEIKEKFNLLFDYKDLTDNYLLTPDYQHNYTDVDSISVLSDVHGEYEFYITLLKSSRIIDNDLNWIYGKGHLVVLGDVFDRGDKVTEVLWHLFGLEKQAAKAGGMVHMVLGNHEIMVLSSDLKYTNEKYIRVDEICNVSYPELYSESSVLGSWLRSKPIMITINDIIFVHGGLSIDIVQRNLKIEQINRIFSDKIIGKDRKTVKKDQELKFLTESNGPIWYRGYFNDSKFSESRVDSILSFYGVKHIVVGHTECDIINSLFDTKILGIDTGGITEDQPGELLIYKKGTFYRGLFNGKRIKL